MISSFSCTNWVFCYWYRICSGVGPIDESRSLDFVSHFVILLNYLMTLWCNFLWTFVYILVAVISIVYVRISFSKSLLYFEFKFSYWTTWHVIFSYIIDLNCRAQLSSLYYWEPWLMVSMFFYFMINLRFPNKYNLVHEW